MVVQTQTDQIENIAKLFEMVASENRQIEVDPLRGYASQELSSLIEQYEVRTDRFSGHQSGSSHQTDDNHSFYEIIPVYFLLSMSVFALSKKVIMPLTL